VKPACIVDRVLPPMELIAFAHTEFPHVAEEFDPDTGHRVEILIV
jgi:hypothetical protein